MRGGKKVGEKRPVEPERVREREREKGYMLFLSGGGGLNRTVVIGEEREESGGGSGVLGLGYSSYSLCPVLKSERGKRNGTNNPFSLYVCGIFVIIHGLPRQTHKKTYDTLFLPLSFLFIPGIFLEVKSKERSKGLFSFYS